MNSTIMNKYWKRKFVVLTDWLVFLTVGACGFFFLFFLSPHLERKRAELRKKEKSLTQIKKRKKCYIKTVVVGHRRRVSSKDGQKGFLFTHTPQTHSFSLLSSEDLRNAPKTCKCFFLYLLLHLYLGAIALAQPQNKFQWLLLLHNLICQGMWCGESCTSYG